VELKEFRGTGLLTMISLSKFEACRGERKKVEYTVIRYTRKNIQEHKINHNFNSWLIKTSKPITMNTKDEATTTTLIK